MNAEKAKPEVEITLDGKLYKLVLDVNAACLIEQVLGREILTGEVFTAMGFTQVRAFLWGMLRSDEPKITLEKVGQLINSGNMKEIVKCIIAAYKRAMPTPDEEVEVKNETSPPA